VNPLGLDGISVNNIINECKPFNVQSLCCMTAAVQRVIAIDSIMLCWCCC